MHISTHIIINKAFEQKIKGMPADVREKIEAILERANKEIDKVLDKNPNL